MSKTSNLLALLSLFAGIGFAPATHAAEKSEQNLAAISRFSSAVQIPTISNRQTEVVSAAFETLNEKIELWYPKTAERLVQGNFKASRLYHWQGTDAGLKPVILLAHTDVVPVDAANKWTLPPFSGALDDGFIWGRGALDNKSNAFAQLEALESLAAEGFAPKRSIWIAHGHDEEIGGSNGAAVMAAYLQSKGVEAWFTLDEGGAVSEGIVQGISRPVAAIFAAEKGYLSIQIVADVPGGHSSMPPEETAISVLNTALQKLEKAPMPARITEPVSHMLKKLAPELPWLNALMIRLLPLSAGVLKNELQKNPTTAAMIRTTSAPTMLSAGVADNVLPSSASAVVNFRLLPGDTVEDVIAHTKKSISDPRIKINPLPGLAHNAPPISATQSAAVELIEASILEFFPDAITISGIGLATTDNRHYQALRKNGYSFSPYPFRPGDRARIHGVDERIAISDYLRMIDFYRHLFSSVGTNSQPQLTQP